MRIKTTFSSIAVVVAVTAGTVLAQQPAAPAKPKPAAPARHVPAAQASYKDLKYPPLNKVKVPEPIRFELANGVVVYLVEDHEVPLISVSALVRTGSRWEPAGKAGLASITGTVMRTGGSVTRPGDQLDEELDRLAAHVETGIGQNSGRAMVSVLKEDIDKGLSILADVLQHPAFPQAKIDLAKIQQRDGIARRNDNPNGIVFREFSRVLFGKDSPYARQTEYETIDSITRDDLVAFHKQFFQPENIILGAWGDFKADEMRGRIEKALGGWERGGQPKPPVPEVDAATRSRSGFYSINKDEMKQSWVVMGMLGGKRNDPDYCALEVMNEILGGKMSSRLFSNVRSAQGLAYAVFSNWGAQWDRPGTFIAGGSSKPETTVKIYHSIRHEIERIAESGVTGAELALAKDGILKSAAFDNDSTDKIVGRLMDYEYYGYPKDFLQQYEAGVGKVARADVARVAAQYLKPERFLVVFLGNEKGYEAPLASLGKVGAIDITIPQPKQKEVAAATPEAARKGKALLAAALEATGGAAVLNVKDFSLKGDGVLHMGDNPINAKFDSVVSLSGKMMQKLQLPMGEMTMAYDGQNGWMRLGTEARDVPASQKGELEGGFFRQSLSLLQKFQDYGVQAVGASDVAGQKLEGVAITGPAQNQQVVVFIDPATRLIVAKRYTASLMGPPAETYEVYSDYRDVGGVKMPFKTMTTQGGAPRAEMTATEVKINPGVEDSAYKKP